MDVTVVKDEIRYKDDGSKERIDLINKKLQDLEQQFNDMKLHLSENELKIQPSKHQTSEIESWEGMKEDVEVIANDQTIPIDATLLHQGLRIRKPQHNETLSPRIFDTKVEFKEINSIEKVESPCNEIEKDKAEKTDEYEEINQKFQLMDFLSSEIFGSQVGLADLSQYERVHNFLHVPWQLEKLFFFGFFVSLDCFLDIFTFLPIRILMDLFNMICHLVFNIHFKKIQLYDLLRGIIIIISTTFLFYVDMSRVYHAIRGQAMIKLYVLFTMIEIFDRLFCAHVQDILDALYFSSRFQPTRKLCLLRDFLFASIFVALHSLLLFSQVVTINVAINSSNSSLLTLLISNNFAELKTSVLKRFEEQNLFQIACSDIVERFKLILILGIISIKSDIEVVFGTACVFIAEMVVDWIKHAFITKFNRIDSIVYNKYLTILCLDITGFCKEITISDHTHHVSRRLGLVSLPLACIVIRMLGKDCYHLFASFSSLGGMLLLILSFLCLVTMKILSTLLLFAYACRSGRVSFSSSSTTTKEFQNLEQLAGIERFTLWKSRIV